MLSSPHPRSSNGCFFSVIQCKQLRVGLFSPTELSVLRGAKRWKSWGPILPSGFVTVCSAMAKHGPYCAQQFQCLWTLYKAAGRRVIANRCWHKSSHHLLATDFFYARIQCWVPQWDRCLNANSSFVEVWCVPSATHVPCICQGQNRVLGFILFISVH